MDTNMASEPRCKFCKGLFSLCAECLVVTLTFIHVLMTAVEILIHYDVIHVPDSTYYTKTETTTASNTVSNDSSSPTPALALGGCDTTLHAHLEDTVQVVRYATLVISAVFLVEIICKVVYLKKYFLKDLWQIFDLVVILISLGLEIAFFIEHNTLLCYHPATEAATFIIILRLWRIPRACDVRKYEYKAKIEDDYRYLRQTKNDKEKECKRLQTEVQNKSVEIEYFKSVLKKHDLSDGENDKIPNGNGPMNNGLSGAVNKMFHKDKQQHSTDIEGSEQVPVDTKLEKNQFNEKARLENTPSNKPEIDLERNDSDKNSRANDSGIEVKDSFRSEREVITAYKKRANHDDEVFCDSDGSEYPVPAKVQEVEVQIEEISRQKQLPSVTSQGRSVGEEDDDKVLIRRKISTQSAAYCENPGYDDTDDVDGGGTYRSADGIPMTEL